jgi:hypothetical protein
LGGAGRLEPECKATQLCVQVELARRRRPPVVPIRFECVQVYVYVCAYVCMYVIARV